MILELTNEQWLLALLGAICTGLGKGGLSGIGNLSIWLYAEAFGARASVGIALPVLICADIVAVIVYRRHADWSHLVRLLPILVLGLVIGYLMFDSIPDALFGKMMGGLLLALTGVHFLRQRMVRLKEQGQEEQIPNSPWVLWGTGIIGGIATMLANAAGPIISFYLLAARMPKYVFIGTAAWVYLIINVIKVPFQAAVDNVSGQTLLVSLALGLVAACFAAIGPLIIRHIPQKLFEALIWAVIVIASVRLIF